MTKNSKEIYIDSQPRRQIARRKTGDAKGNAVRKDSQYRDRARKQNLGAFAAGKAVTKEKSFLSEYF